MNQQVTLVPTTFQPDAMTTPTLQSILKDIKQGKYAKPITAYREALKRANAAKELLDADKENKALLQSHGDLSKRAKKMKGNLPAFLHGTFAPSVNEEHYIAGTAERLIIDVDTINPDKLSALINKLTKIECVAFAFKSPSGNGIKIGINVSPIVNNDHCGQIYEVARKFIFGVDPALIADESCKNIGRFCYVSDDKDTHINLDQSIPLGGTEFNEALVIAVVVPPSVLNGELMPVDPDTSELCCIKVSAMILNAPDGGCHAARLRTGTLAGGYVAGGLVDVAEIMAALRRASDKRDPTGETSATEWKAVTDGYAEGLKVPILALINDFDKHSSEDEWKLLLADHVTQWNISNFSTILGGAHRIGRWEDPEASAANVRTLKYYTSEALSKVHANTLIQTGIKTVAGTKYPVYSNHFEAWYKNTKSASHTGGVIFLPSNKPVPPRDISSKYYNTWEGYSVNPVQNDEVLTRLRYHIMEVICSGDESLYNYIYKWFAYIFQYPELPAGSAIVLRGLEGAGKGVLGSFIQSLWGIHGVKIGSSKHLTGSFNALLADACFTFADEAFFSGDRQQADVLKGLVTESTFNIERKGVDTVAQTNYLKIFMSTNSDYAVPAGKDSRRYFVTDVSPKYLNDKSYFDPLVADCKSEAVKSAFLYDMLNMDLTGWSTSQIPDSEGLRNQRYHSMDTVKKWFVDVLIKGTVKDDFDNESGDYWDDKVSSEDLFTNYLRWCDQAKAGEYKRLVQCELVKYLSKIFSSARDVGGRGKRGIIFGNLTNAIDKFESYEKIFIHELTSDTAF